MTLSKRSWIMFKQQIPHNFTMIKNSIRNKKQVSKLKKRTTSQKKAIIHRYRLRRPIAQSTSNPRYIFFRDLSRKQRINVLSSWTKL